MQIGYSLDCNIWHDTKHHYRKMRKVTIITVTIYKYNNNTTKLNSKINLKNKTNCSQVLITFQVHKRTQ